MIELKQFNMVDHIERLITLKEEPSQFVCECPVCNGQRLTINKDTGAYRCWSGGCETKDIREKVSPWADVCQQKVRDPNQSIKPNKQRKNLFANQSDLAKDAVQQDSITLATLPQPATDSPQPQKRLDKRRSETVVTTYRYSPTQGVERIQYEDKSKPKGYNKTFKQWHLADAGEEVPIWKNGKAVGHRLAQPEEQVYNKGSRPWLPYRWDEAVQAAKDSGANAILFAEGEQAVEKYRQIGLAAVTLQGSSWGEPDLQQLAEMVQAENLSVVSHPDLDRMGKQKAQKLKKMCDHVGVQCVVIEPKHIVPNLPDAADIVDILATGLEVPDFIRLLNEEICRVLEKQSCEQEQSDLANTTFNQQVLSALYTDILWICVNEVLYRWAGTYYAQVEDPIEARRIRDFANTLSKLDKKGNISYPYATPQKVKEALAWIKISFARSPTEVNPANALNCANGVLMLDWQSGIPQPILEAPHDPQKHYFTHEPTVRYDPTADPTSCDQLLQVLDEPQRTIFLQLAGASLDLPEVRKLKGRSIRAALCSGLGNNGKDSLRTALAQILGGRGITSITLSDFCQYDKGRKFSVSKLHGSKINWASENSDFVAIDKLQALKAGITGDPIEIEGKNKDGYESSPNAVFFFNVNDVPRIQGAIEAIKSRFAILSFSKTFVDNPSGSKGELKADSRFKYDTQFLKEQVCPALLNRMIAALQDLVVKGIDYSSTNQALLDIQVQNSHLYQFAADVGLVLVEGNRIPIKALWQQLEQWYIADGTLQLETNAYGKECRVWTERTKSFDKNVKGANQIAQRFTQLFPTVKRVHLGDNKWALEGLGFISTSEINQSVPQISQENPTE